MKSLFPELEIYKADQDVTAGDISEELTRELGDLFKKHGFFIRFLIQTGQEKEPDVTWVLPKWLARFITRITKNQ